MQTIILGVTIIGIVIAVMMNVKDAKNQKFITEHTNIMYQIIHEKNKVLYYRPANRQTFWMLS